MLMGIEYHAKHIRTVPDEIAKLKLHKVRHRTAMLHIFPYPKEANFRDEHSNIHCHTILAS